MESELKEVAYALESVNQEIKDLEKTLSQARKKKTELQNKKAELEYRIRVGLPQEQKPNSPADPPKQDVPPSETQEELQARIAELQRQIEIEQQKAQRAKRSQTPSTVPVNPKTSESAPQKIPQKGDEKKSKGWLFGLGGRNKTDDSVAVEEPDVEDSQEKSSPKPADPPPPSFSKTASSPPIEQPISPAGRTSSTSSDTATHMIGAKPKSVWERPDWAHAMDKQDDRAVLNDPISNALALSNAPDGYRRQVAPKDLDIQKGKVIKAQGKTPDPRLAWLVMRINDAGVPGKIVIHLYGKDVDDLVDQFVGLKDTSAVVGGPNKASLTIQSNPPLYILVFGSAAFDAKPGVYGVVQEGHDILDKVVLAGENAKISVKQAHIYPIKKSKGGI